MAYNQKNPNLKQKWVQLENMVRNTNEGLVPLGISLDINELVEKETEAESEAAVYTDTTILDFGIYTGTMVKDLPLEYLAIMRKTKGKKISISLHNYAKANEEQILTDLRAEQEAKRLRNIERKESANKIRSDTEVRG